MTRDSHDADKPAALRSRVDRFADAFELYNHPTSEAFDSDRPVREAIIDAAWRSARRFVLTGRPYSIRKELPSLGGGGAKLDVEVHAESAHLHEAFFRVSLVSPEDHPPIKVILDGTPTQTVEGAVELDFLRLMRDKSVEEGRGDDGEPELRIVSGRHADDE